MTCGVVARGLRLALIATYRVGGNREGLHGGLASAGVAVGRTCGGRDQHGENGSSKGRESGPVHQLLARLHACTVTDFQA
jgi:hypothetical protein